MKSYISRWMRRWTMRWMMVDKPPDPWRSSGPPHIDARQFGWNLCVWRSQIATSGGPPGGHRLPPGQHPGWCEIMADWEKLLLHKMSKCFPDAKHLGGGNLDTQVNGHMRKLLVVSDCYSQLLDDTDYNGRRWRFQMLMEFERLRRRYPGWR